MERDIAEQAGALAGISVLSANVRVIALSDRYSFWGAFRASLFAFFAGLLVGLCIYEEPWHTSIKFAILCVVGVIAEDLVRAIILIGKKVTEKPLEFITDFILRR